MKITNLILRIFKRINQLHYPLMVLLDASLINLKIKHKKTKGLFIDCGSNVGQGFNFFKKFFTPKYFDYVMFEPNPHCFEHLITIEKSLKKTHNIKILKKAIGKKNQIMRFYGLHKEEGGQLSQGGSTVSSHNSRFYKTDLQKSILVKSISFAKFITSQYKEYKTIVIKMDIEGAEYEVLNDLIEKKILNQIDIMYVEFHSSYMKENLKKIYEKKEKIIKKVFSKTNCKLRIWV